MAATHFDTLIGKLMSDDAFAANLASNPEQARRTAGIEPTGELLDALKGVDVGSIRQMASAFKDNRAAAS